MKNIFHFLTFCLVTRTLVAIPITDDFNRAREIAQAYDRPMVLFFAGSDWCEWSKKILKHVFAPSSFSEVVGNQFVFVKVDFPEINQQPQSVLNQNQALRERFQVKSFPLLVLLDKEGQEMTRLSYVDEAPETFARHLKRLFSDYRAIDRDYKALEFAKAPITAIEALYKRASKLQSPHYLDKLLQIGLAADEGIELPLEKYADLVQNNQANTLFGEALKTKILKRDPDNRLGARLRLALLDFQANEQTPEKAVEALNTYIADHGQKDHDNLWRLHLLISDYFQQQGKVVQAKEHAEKCLKEAPDSMKKELLEVFSKYYNSKTQSE